jgi:hypothetical protein
MGWEQVRAEKQAVEGNDPHGDHGYVCEGDMALCWNESSFSGLVVSMLMSGTQDRGFEPG